MRSPRDGKLVLCIGQLEGAVPARGINADRTHLDVMITRIAHDLSGCIKAHWLGIQQCRAETSGCQHFIQDEA